MAEDWMDKLAADFESNQKTATDDLQKEGQKEKFLSDEGMKAWSKLQAAMRAASSRIKGMEFLKTGDWDFAVGSSSPGRPLVRVWFHTDTRVVDWELRQNNEVKEGSLLKPFTTDAKNFLYEEKGGAHQFTVDQAS